MRVESSRDTSRGKLVKTELADWNSQRDASYRWHPTTGQVSVLCVHSRDIVLNVNQRMKRESWNAQGRLLFFTAHHSFCARMHSTN